MEGYTPGNEKLAEENRQRIDFVIGCLRNLGKEKRPIAAGDVVVVLDEQTKYEPVHVVKITEHGIAQISEAPNMPTFEAPVSDVYHIRDWSEAFETALQYQQKAKANRLS